MSNPLLQPRSTEPETKMSEEKNEGQEAEAKVKRGTRRVERQEESAEASIRKKIVSIRAGHTTGGYCDTEALHNEEKKLYHILAVRLEEAEAKHGTHFKAEFQHPTVRALKLEINGLSYKPQLVVKE